MWIDVTPPMMSDEEPMPDGKIARRRPSWRSETFNEFMETLDQRVKSSLKKISQEGKDSLNTDRHFSYQRLDDPKNRGYRQLSVTFTIFLFIVLY